MNKKNIYTISIRVVVLFLKGLLSFFLLKKGLSCYDAGKPIYNQSILFFAIIIVPFLVE